MENANNELHKLYHDARARAALQMRENGATRQEIGDFFGIKKAAVTNVINRAMQGGKTAPGAHRQRKSHLLEG